MKTYKILQYERLNNSVNGNPRYKFYLLDPAGVFHIATTKSDYAYVYGIFNHGYDTLVCRLEKTRAGNYKIVEVK